MQRTSLALGGLVVVLVGAAPVRAQDAGSCDDSLERAAQRFMPAIGAGGVTLDAPVKLEYSEGYFEDPVIDANPRESIELYPAGSEKPVSGSVQVYGGNTLVFVPDAPLEPDTRYEGTAFGFDADKDFRFHTGRSRDTRPPELGEITSVRSSRIEPRCDAPEGGYRIDVNLPPADDDGPSGSIEYLLYLSRGPGVDSPELRARRRGFATDVITMAFVLEPDKATGPICVVVHATDGVGKIDDDGNPRCFDPIEGNYFEPLCAASTRGLADGHGAMGMVLVSLATIAARRRRRR